MALQGGGPQIYNQERAPTSPSEAFKKKKFWRMGTVRGSVALDSASFAGGQQESSPQGLDVHGLAHPALKGWSDVGEKAAAYSSMSHTSEKFRVA
ncbi:hypothetical protein cyc_00850 [Cyclospora cayetanensis]|uniref:Uncharacterized protein n=1 Tax=Cyclospora cayetanensis TaxID=88456 RepID=A0A1D3CUR9_9EIME|nr:hypothetical protein cyc_00850 [Cyclospora cayetanensis]